MQIEQITFRREPDYDADTSYLDQPEFADRKAAYGRGEFGFIGIYAVAHLRAAGTLQVVRSAGLWGIEDDSGEKYLGEIEQEEMHELMAVLEDMQMIEPERRVS